MKKFALAVAVAATIAAPQAFAQTGQFTGFSAQGAVSVVNNHMGGSPVLTLTGNIDNAEAINSSSSTKVMVNLGMAYTFGMSDKWVMGVALDGNPFKSDIGTGTGAEADVVSKMDNSYSLTIQPGYALDSESLVYGKFGYSEAKVKNSYGGALGQSGALGSLNSNTYKGYVAGVGYKRFIDKNLYFFGEANYTRYGKERIIALSIFYADRNLSNFAVMGGVGYKF